MNDHLKALVIGGSGKLGSTVCELLAKNGFDLAFTYCRNREKADMLAKDLREQGCAAPSFRLDLTDAEQVRAVIGNVHRSLGGLDSLIVTSGLATGHFENNHPKVPKYFDITPEAYDTMMNVNVRGVFFACQQAAKIMSGSGGGRIVITGSVDGVKPMPAPIDYASCKAALWGMTQAMAKELGKYDILVNMVAPGILDGGIGDLLSDELRKEYLKHCSLRRIGKFGEVANMIAFLAGHSNTYITSQAVLLDGGL